MAMRMTAENSDERRIDERQRADGRLDELAPADVDRDRRHRGEHREEVPARAVRRRVRLAPFGGAVQGNL